MSSIYPGYGNSTVQRCERCGQPLSTNTNGFCGHCGMQNAPSQPNNASGQLPFSSSTAWGVGQPQPVQGSGQPGQWDGPPLEQTPQSGLPQPPFGLPTVPQSPFGYQPSFNAPPAPQSQQPFYQIPMLATHLQHGILDALNNGGNLDPNFSNNRKKPKVGLIIGISVLVLLLLSAGFGGYMILSSLNSTTTVATQVVTPTATPKGPPLFSDSFQNNNKGWDLTGKAGEYSVAVGAGTLALEDDNNRLLWELFPGGKTYDNFLLNVDAVLSKGTQDNGYGIYIRAASNQTVDIATYYRFELYGDGTFAVFKGTLDASGTSQSSSLVDNSTNAAILTQGHVNHISILAENATLSLIVNGQLLTTITDNSYTSGSIALFVSNLANAPAGAQAKFSNLVIYPPQS